MLEEVTNQQGSTPPCYKHGQKNGHSPWSAPRERKRRSKPAQEAGHLSSIEEIEKFTSPPKLQRTNGVSGTAVRELPLAHAPLGSPFAAEAAAAAWADAGPLAQGLFALSTSSATIAPSDEGNSFAPLASGLAASFEQPWPASTASAGGCDKHQRKHPRQTASFRLASAKQRAATASVAEAAVPVPPSQAGPALAAGAAGPDSGAGLSMLQPQLSQQQQQQAPSSIGTLLWEPGTAAGTNSLPFGLRLAVQQPQPPAPAADLQQQLAPQPLELQPPCTAVSQPLPAAVAQHTVPLPAPAPQPHTLAQQLIDLQPAPAALPHLSYSLSLHEGSLGGIAAAAAVARHSSGGHNMDTDLRSSWGSERSADISSWQAVQAQLCEEVDAMRTSGQGRLLPLCESLEELPVGEAEAQHAGHAGPLAVGAGRSGSAAGARRPGSMLGDPLRASADGGASLRSSLEGLQLCAERQTSLLPLRATMRSHQWHSHLPQPAPDGASPDPLLGRPASGNRRRSRGNPKWSCFSCASPFSCKGSRQQQQQQDDSDDEIVRRNESEDFVIRRKQSFPPPSALREERESVERPRRATLNRPPSGGDQTVLAQRDDAFSLRCSSTPGGPWSPFSEAGSDDSFSLASGPGLHTSVGLGTGLEELAVGASSEGGTPTVDALNDMLKALSLCPHAHPKDAEELVLQACQSNSIQPNATTARTLEKMWAVHEQLYG